MRLSLFFIVPAVLIAFSSAAQETVKYGKNVITLSPVHMTESTPTGIGVEYERFFGGSDKFSAYLPVAYSFGMASACDPDIRLRMLYTYPGFKFYPLGYKHKYAYSVGPSLAFGKGTTNCDCGDDVPSGYHEVNGVKIYKSITRMGVLLNNSLNIQANKHIVIGAEAGIGFTYLNKLNNKDKGTDVMFQINLRAGYRF